MKIEGQDNTGYKVSFKDCLIDDRKNFNYSSCILPISVGQPVHNGIKFQNTLEYIIECFSSCCILVDDTIQKYTLAIINELSPQECYKEAKHNGDKWLMDNAGLFIKKFYSKLKIIRWNYWLGHHNFYYKYEDVISLYKNDSYYREAFAHTSKEFISRLKKSHTISDENRAFDLCIEYLKEECAVMCLWADSGFEFEVYPYGRNAAMEATYNKIIKNQYPSMLKSVSLRFKKRNSVGALQ